VLETLESLENSEIHRKTPAKTEPEMATLKNPSSRELGRNTPSALSFIKTPILNWGKSCRFGPFFLAATIYYPVFG